MASQNGLMANGLGGQPSSSSSVSVIATQSMARGLAAVHRLGAL